MALHRFWYSRNGYKDVYIPRLNYWYFSYRIFSRIKASGIGRMPRDEVYEMGKNDLNALNLLLGEKKFVFGDTKPSNIDFSLFGLLVQIKYTDRGPLNHHLICK